MKKIFIFILLVCFISEINWAQKNYRFQTYGVDDGLSQSNIRVILQDSLGFLWLGTAKGLNRFDGQTFKTYQPSKDSTQSGLVHQEINDIIADREGILWIATLNGLSRFDPKLDKFTNFKTVGDCIDCLIRGHISTLVEDREFIWIGTAGGLSRIHKTEYTITSWPYVEGDTDGPKKTSIREMVKLDTNKLVIASNEGISIFNSLTNTFTHITEAEGLLENKVQSLFRDSKGRFWIGYETLGMSLLTGSWEKPAFRHYPFGKNGPAHGFVYCIEEAPDGRLWVATFNGLTIFDTRTETFQQIHKTKGALHTLASNQILSLYRDDANRMWIGTQLGLNLYDPYLDQFTFLVSEKNNERSLAANETFSIFEDSKGGLWIGNYANGLTVIHDLEGEKHFRHIAAGNGLKQLSGAQVLDFEEDDLGRIWVATFNGINIIDWPDRNTDQFTIRRFPLTAVPNNPHLSQYTYMVTKGPNGTMWIGTHGAGAIMIRPDGQMKQYCFQEKPQGITENIVLNIAFDDKERVWLAHNPLGISTIDTYETTDFFTHIAPNPLFQLNSIHQILFDFNNGVLISTDTGLIHFKDKDALRTGTNTQFTVFDEAAGVSDDVVYGIEKIKEGTYWLSTGNGLSILNTQTKEVVPIKEVLGPLNFEFNQGASEFTKDGTLYFGGVDGVVSIRPEAFQKNKNPPRVYLSDARILNEPIPISEAKTKKTSLPMDMIYLNKLTLQPTDKIVSFAIQPVNFTLPKHTTFSYKLEGFDEGWTTTTNPVITRSNLDPGTYTLIAKAANNDGLWSEPVALQIEMIPPWYRTWWAYILFAMGLVGLVYMLLKLRLQQERKVELARAQERDIFRKRSSRDFHDEAGTRITRIALITELARLESKDNLELQQYLTQIDDNLQDLNNGMRDFIWTLDPAMDNAYDTLTRFTEFAGNFCECAGIQFKSEDLSADLKSRELNMAERRHVLLILKEALNNSVKHGAPSLVRFGILQRPGKLIVTLEDNGSGFKTEENNGGYGLSNMQERAEALGGILTIDSHTRKGTKLTLTLETTRLGN
ncbi:sensor histidine kinase [Altibacter sp.]|uniref:sensor histidine kinase n=1 Tax=Altibacter sp. TaxID=2024823 RepID=UPI00258EAD56|nr:sensor histidine kinase [Altibacter sp.]MCW9038145.1 triple tyrosine motif-containing protein [Altibacter sp.]